MGRLIVAGVCCAALSGTPTASAGAGGCGFHPLYHRTIAELHHISCAQAKRVLRRLKGDRDTVPMVCGHHPRYVRGWRLRNPDRQLGIVFTDYRRGHVWFEYQRFDHEGRLAWCPPTNVPYDERV